MTPSKETTTATPEQSLNDAVVSEMATRASRDSFDAGLIPPPPGDTGIPSLTAAEAVLEDTTQSVRSIQNKAVSGAKALGVRTLVSLVLRAVSSLTLSHFLIASDYGVFAAVAGIAGLGQYFCDGGMGNVLVTQESEPTPDEVTTVFLLQQGFTAIVVAAILATIPLLLSIYNAPVTAAPFLIAISLTLFPAALRFVPALRLERTLNFTLQAKTEMIENTAQVCASVLLATLHLGTWALIGGVITARIVGLIVTYCVSEWRLRGRFRIDIAKRYAARGTQFLFTMLAPSIFGASFTMIIGRMLGFGGLGLFGWAGALATIPLMLSNMLNRVVFPSMSRLQSNPAEIGRLTTVMVRRISLTLSVCFAPVIIFSPILLPVIFSSKWITAIPLFQWAIMDTINYTTLGLLAQTLSATGYLTQRLIGAVVGGALKMLVLYAAIRLLGLHGAGIGNYVGTLAELGLLGFYTRKHMEGSGTILQNIALPILGVQGAAALGLFVAHGLFGATAGLNLSALLSSLVAVGIFAAGLLLYNVFVKGRPVTTELSGILRLLKTRS